MGFPKVFYCVCEEPGCVWNRPGYQAFGCRVVEVGKHGVNRYTDPDPRPTRIAGSSYWNTCRYFAVIVFEAVFIRTLRNLVRDRVVSLDVLLDVLYTLVRQPRCNRRFVEVHDSAIQRIAEELGYLESVIGRINGHFDEIIRLVRHLVNQNRALLDERREPRYWPTRAVALEAMRNISAQRRLLRGHAPASRRVA